MSKYYSSPYKNYRHFKTLFLFRDKEYNRRRILIYSAEKDLRTCNDTRCVFNKICVKSLHLKCMYFLFFKQNLKSEVFTKSTKIDFLLHKQ